MINFPIKDVNYTTKCAVNEILGCLNNKCLRGVCTGCFLYHVDLKELKNHRVFQIWCLADVSK